MNNIEIKSLCKKYNIKNYTIENGVVDVNGNVDLSNKGLNKLPLRFGVVNGDFNIDGNVLYRLCGMPSEVKGAFIYDLNKKGLSYDDYLKEVHKELSKEVKINFITYFDGCFDFEPVSNSSTYSLGVCKLEYKLSSNTLIVSLRRPGLLIGEGGRDISKLEKFLDVTIGIIEIDLLK